MESQDVNKEVASEDLLNEEPHDYAFQSLSAVREVVSIAKRQPAQVSYEAALDIIYEQDEEFGDRIYRTLAKRNKTDEVRYFIELAEAQSTDEKVVEPTELIEKELVQIEDALARSRGKGNSLNKRKIALLGALKWFQPRKVSEHKVLGRDFYLRGVKLPGIVEVYKDEKFADYRLADDRFLRLRLLHPDEEEEILGCDIVYEQFDLARERVRFAHIQFKMWQKQGLYLKHHNLPAQLDKVKANLCSSGYCSSESGHNVGGGWRFPFVRASCAQPTSNTATTPTWLVAAFTYLYAS